MTSLVLPPGLHVVDATTIDVFLAPSAGAPDRALLFFTGDPALRTEAADVAVVLPQLLAAFAGRLRAALVARAAEAALQARFRVVVVPSLVVTRGGEVLGVLPRIRPWAEYLATIEACLAPDAPPLPPAAAPQVRITVNGAGAVA